jgi:hypothetical protein
VTRNKERVAMSLSVWLALFVLPTIALMMVSVDMARARKRSARAWVWIAAITGPLPLGPLVLYLLGDRR